jgi:hypothetical protein
MLIEIIDLLFSAHIGQSRKIRKDANMSEPRTIRLTETVKGAG